MTNLQLSRRNILPLIVLLILIVSACGGAAASDDAPATEEPAAPQPTFEAVEEPAEDEPSVITPLPTQSVLPAIPERRRITLEFPPQIRVGDSDRVRLTLEVDDRGNIVPTAEVEGNVVTGEVVEIPNLYETHHVIAEAKFDITGVQVSPSEIFSQTLSQGQSVTFYWSVRPQEMGVYRGTIWFYLRFVDNVSGKESQKTVSAQLVEIEAVSLLGIPTGLVRTFGGVGSVVGAVIGFPFFEDIVRFIFGRRKRLKK